MHRNHYYTKIKKKMNIYAYNMLFCKTPFLIKNFNGIFNLFGVWDLSFIQKIKQTDEKGENSDRT